MKKVITNNGNEIIGYNKADDNHYWMVGTMGYEAIRIENGKIAYVEFNNGQYFNGKDADVLSSITGLEAVFMR